MSDRESSQAIGVDGNSTDTSLSLEINTNHRYKAEEMGVLEFRIRNQGSQTIQALDLVVDCPCEKSQKKSAALKNLAPSTEKRPFFQFEPARGGEALLEIEISLEAGSDPPRVYRGQTSVSISSKDESRTSPTSFNLNFHDIEKFMGNDLSGLLTIAGKGINEDRLRERMERREPFWMRVDLEFDEHESEQRFKIRRRIISLPGGQTQVRARRALLEALDPSAPQRTFIYSMPQIAFGRHAARNDAVLRFLPDFYQDERSKTISAEQFVTRYFDGQVVLMLAPEGHAPVSFDGRMLKQNVQVPFASGSEIRIGPYEFTLQISCIPRIEDPHWMTTWMGILRSDPADDPFKMSRWDAVSFLRTANGPEEEYLWLMRKTEIGWEATTTTGVQWGQSLNPRARLSYWNGRYYLEALDSGTEIKVAGRILQYGDIACLGGETDISFGPLCFHWKLI